MGDEFEEAATSIDSLSRLHMYIYQPTFEPAEDFSWENFLKAGSDLAEELARLVTEVRYSPLRFVARLQKPPPGSTDNRTVSK